MKSITHRTLWTGRPAHYLFYSTFLICLILAMTACSNIFQGGGGSGGSGGGNDSPGAPGRVLTVRLSGDSGGVVQVNPSLGPVRTMLPSKPVFTRYQLVFTNASGVPLEVNDPSYHAPVDFFNSITQIPLEDGAYYFIALGYVGDDVAAKSAVSAAPVTVSGNVITNPSDGILSFILKPYEEPENKGTLAFSLSWEGLDDMPNRAELLITKYGDYDGDGTSAGNTWEPIPAEYILETPGISYAGTSGTILLLRNDRVSEAYSALSGALSLPPGEYMLKVTLFWLDSDGNIDSSIDSGDIDVAHIYSNLTTPAAFHYGSGRFTLSNETADPGAPFITSFNFAETPGATSVIGSTAGTDGTRLIMVMVPPNTTDADLVNGLTPLVTTAPGSHITFPVPASVLGGGSGYARGEIDFTHPTSWTVQSTSGAVQNYTVVVSKSAVEISNITYFSFDEYSNYPGIIDQTAQTITITLPPDASLNLDSLTPDIFFMGKKVVYVDEFNDEHELSEGPFDFSSNLTPKFWVYDNNEPPISKEYTVTIGVASSAEAVITKFAISGYPAISFTVDSIPTVGTITGTLPYGVSLAHLTPIITYKGKSLSPSSGQGQDFRVPVSYTVTADDGITTKTYQVTLTNAPADTNARIAEFSIANIPGCEILIGTNPRAEDGKIPIVVQVPYAASYPPLIPAITLASPTSTIALDDSGFDAGLPFANTEYSYTVTAEAGNTQQYAVTISGKGASYYVNGTTGIDDGNPNAGSQARPFKTLAWAVDKTANNPGINKIVVSGELNNDTEGGAWEDNDASPTYFHASGGRADSVFYLNGTGRDVAGKPKRITITGGTLRGTTGKRVLYVAGGADLVFENTIITGGNLPGSSLGVGGGGIYITGGSTIKLTGGSISNNSAPNGGGVYLYDSGATESFFTLMGGSIISNNATLKAGWAGGGGVSVNGRSTFWMASGTIANNTAAQDGAAVQVYGQFNGLASTDINYGFIMSGGVITGNRGLYCGGVYVSSGEFEMIGGEICLNRTNAATNGAGLYALIRDGGIVINIGGSSSINSNASDFAENKEAGTVYQGNRNIAFTIRGDARVNTVYVDIPGVTGDPGTGFNLGENARVGTIFLNYNANPPVVADLLGMDSLTDRIAILDLTGTLSQWINKPVLNGGITELDQIIANNRFRLYNNGTDITATHRLQRSGTNAVLQKK